MKGPKEQQQENVPVTNAFELQRQQRIQRNKRVLCELGLENAGQQLVAAPAKRSKPRAPKEQQQPLEPSRKSRRLQGDKPELQPIAGRRWRHGNDDECDESLPADQQQPRSSTKSSSSRKPAQQEAQQHSSWTGEVDAAAVEALMQQEPDNPHHAHNFQRLRSMSCKALLTRVVRITNMAKLQSLIKVMEAGGGPEEVLAAAHEKMGEF